MLEKSFNSLIDAKNAIAIRQSLVLTEIGICIEQLTSRLALYNSDSTAMLSVNNDINSIHDESDKQSLPINFYGLEYHRSTSSNYGSSFLQQQRSLRIQMEPFLSSTHHLRTTASGFLTDPSSHFFALLGSGRGWGQGALGVGF